MSTQATVVVCTRNRLTPLARCLATLVDQAGLAEILVVENGPGHAATRSLAAKAGARYLVEARLGSGPARNRGLHGAGADLVAFVDDDCEAEPGWLRELLDPFQDPGVHAVTGQVIPRELTTPAQRLFERYFPYSKGDQLREFGPGPAPYPFPLNANEMGTGANMAFRRRTLSELGGFVDALSAGGPARGGEDIQALYAILDAGFRLVYQPGARVSHPNPATAAELDRVFFNYGVAHFAYLTHCLWAGRNPRVIRRAASVLAHYAGRLAASRGSDLPPRFLLRHLVGSCLGPPGYLAARIRYG